ncbi:acetyltransferase [Levilactobacillus namurensis DSM 19117]|uniref:Acetyltransferase n=2 Tax=Levilactobacillus namurensis TaxID=380393 RepID=A0A0R1JQQ8_9LACO|nr:GNAT family N-acetyltransferase [Levilactobacillus namurensis]PTM24923.1 N-acetyltransferase [Lactobacillus sp. PFC-70]KRK73500.1 acetyltransferase [Levilactobacillus namurensis DSM 19117]MCW3779201.1 GNAT family N-acetyltransferase [Levilactobacillus namurensis]MDT7013146.1 GNAT family N-acetyltransferase [Levilactobacillus namurensis]MDT7020019.1 GNAT family N-acetyltransferase [Levilactobacillus namurensis]
MYLRKAKPDELELVLDIIEDGKKQLADAGIDQWQNDYPNRETIMDDINAGRAVIYNSDDHETLGVASVVQAPDHSYDTLDGGWLVNTDHYVAVHRVAIFSHHQGKGYASKLFQDLFAYIAKNHPESQSIRIDTHQDNAKMQHLIVKNGFTKVGAINGVYQPDDACFVYEKDLRQAHITADAS